MSIKSEQQNKKSANFFEKFDTGNLINNASNIVLKAANILEQNIAEGIIAAQKVEKKLVDTDKIRSNKDDLMNRFRKDTHEAMDIFFDALALATQNLQELAKNAQTGDTTKPNPTAQNIPVLSIEDNMTPGSDAVIPLTLENESKTEEMRLKFHDQGLRMDDDNTIHNKNVSYDPKLLILKPGETGVVNIRVHIPKSAREGVYSGLIREKTLAGLEAMIRVQVKAQ